MLRTIDSVHISTISDFVRLAPYQDNAFQFVLLQVIDSGFLPDRTVYWLYAIHKICGSEPEFVDVGLLINWDAFLILIDAGYFNGFDEVWLLPNRDSLHQLVNAVNKNSEAPEPFSDSSAATIFCDTLTNEHNIVGLYDGIGLSIITGNKEILDTVENLYK